MRVQRPKSPTLRGWPQGSDALATQGVGDGDGLGLREGAKLGPGTREVNPAPREDEGPARAAEQVGGRLRLGASRPDAEGRDPGRVDPQLVPGKVELAVRHVLRHVEDHRPGAPGGGDGVGAAHELRHPVPVLDPDELLRGRGEDLVLARLLGHVLPRVRAVRVADDRDEGNARVERLDEPGREVRRTGAEGRVADPGAPRDPGEGVGREGAAPLVVDEGVAEPELADRIVEGEELEPAHPEHRSAFVDLQHFRQGATPGHAAGRVVRDLGHLLVPLLSVRCSVSSQPLPSSAG